MRIFGVIMLGCLALLHASCGRGTRSAGRDGGMEPAAFWVWHRGSGLGDGEIERLNAAGTKRLYWQVAEIGWEGGRWRAVKISDPRVAPEGVEVIPVFRLKPRPEFLSRKQAAVELAELVRSWVGETNVPAEVQLDFDCPDRLLVEYAAFLKSFRRGLPPLRVSVTALAGWVDRPGFGKLAAAVDALAPMFYDLHPDEPAEVLRGNFQPMAVEETAGRIGRWSACPVEWRAGLANFERVSVFGSDGLLRGHLRGWSHDAVFFHPDLEPGGTREGVTVYRVLRACALFGTKVEPGDFVVHRTPDERVTEVLKLAADRAGATSLVYFALPGPGLQAACSAPHLAGGKPELSLAVTARGEVVLRNAGPGELPPRAVDPDEVGARGWCLELTGAGFQSGGPGAFAAKDGGVPGELSGRVILRFSKLPAGASLVSGRLVGDTEGLRWRVRGAGDSQFSDVVESGG